MGTVRRFTFKLEKQVERIKKEEIHNSKSKTDHIYGTALRSSIHTTFT